MNYLSSDAIAAINEVVIEETGGSIGVREAGLLDSIANKPAASFGDKELYSDIFTKAAALYEAIVNYHVFIDGNKRTGFAAMARFLAINDYALNVTNQEIEDFTLFIATQNPDIAVIASWIEQHATSL